jgi:hypothetical protein
MKKFIFHFIATTFLMTNSCFSFAQSFSIEIIIKNQPNNIIIFGAIKGDSFTAIDSAFAKNELVRFNIPENANTGMYRIIMGQSAYAKVMNEDPQQLDFIFNNENVVLETDFDDPANNVNIIQSKENIVWFRFKRKEKILTEQLIEFEKEVNYLWSSNKTQQAINKANEYNQLQIERDLFVTQSLKETVNLFSEGLIQTFKKPILDGYLTKEQRDELFKKDYLKSVNFNNESLIYSQAYTDKVFEYLLSYNQIGFTKTQRENAYIKATDKILSYTAINKEVNKFIIDYLIHGFGVLKLEKVIDHIRSNYPQ